jgi:hypothetical protein
LALLSDVEELFEKGILECQWISAVSEKGVRVKRVKRTPGLTGGPLIPAPADGAAMKRTQEDAGELMNPAPIGGVVGPVISCKAIFAVTEVRRRRNCRGSEPQDLRHMPPLLSAHDSLRAQSALGRNETAVVRKRGVVTNDRRGRIDVAWRKAFDECVDLGGQFNERSGVGRSE